MWLCRAGATTQSYVSWGPVDNIIDYIPGIPVTPCNGVLIACRGIILYSIMQFSLLLLIAFL